VLAGALRALWPVATLQVPCLAPARSRVYQLLRALMAPLLAALTPGL